MAIELTETDEYVSVFRWPIVSVRVPPSWVNEAIDHDAHVSKSSNSPEWLRGWHSARRLGKRGFAAYYGLRTQFEERHDKWESGRPDYDYIISSSDRSCLVNVHTIPIKDHNPKIGRDFSCRLYRSRYKGEYPIIHVLGAWWCPTLFFIGWIPNTELSTRGKTEIRLGMIQPIHKHDILSNLDARNMFL